jgi:PilZ domain-containing protein
MLRCPRCGQQAARRSPRAGAWEHAVSLLYVYPFRCQLCATRFRAVQFRRYRHHSPDRREYDRLLVRVPVTLSSGAGQAPGETVDLALNGCSVRTEGAFAPGASVQVRLRLGQAGDVNVESAVVRSQRDGGVGLQFARMAGADRERLSRYLAGFLRPSGTGRRRRGLPPPEVLVAAAVGALIIIMVFMLLGRVGAPTLR